MVDLPEDGVDAIALIGFCHFPAFRSQPSFGMHNLVLFGGLKHRSMTSWGVLRSLEPFGGGNLVRWTKQRMHVWGVNGAWHRAVDLWLGGWWFEPRLCLPNYTSSTAGDSTCSKIPKCENNSEKNKSQWTVIRQIIGGGWWAILCILETRPSVNSNERNLIRSTVSVSGQCNLDEYCSTPFVKYFLTGTFQKFHLKSPVWIQFSNLLLLIHECRLLVPKAVVLRARKSDCRHFIENRGDIISAVENRVGKNYQWIWCKFNWPFMCMFWFNLYSL